MRGRRICAISSDIDSLDSIYKGRGCVRPGGYSRAELEIGFENFSKFLAPYKAKATLFMVGEDFLFERNAAPIKAMRDEGHEIANHTMTHAQGFRLLSPAEKEKEIAGMEEACFKLLGARPKGFRSPGWNVGDDALEILVRRGYEYDSSVFPTFLSPLLKFMHWRSTGGREGGDRTTLGHLKYVFAPTTPYRCSKTSLGSKGDSGFMELPVAVTPFFRLPFFATFFVSAGLGAFDLCWRAMRASGRDFQFQFHLSDFVDYTVKEFEGQVPAQGSGVYVPAALGLPLAKKLELFKRMMDAMAEDCEFDVLSGSFMSNERVAQ